LDTPDYQSKENMMQQGKQITGPLIGQFDSLGKRIEALEETLAQLKTLDRALHEMQFIIFSYVEKIDEGLVLIQDEILVWANRAACRILGYTLDEVINKSAIGLAHPKYRDQLSARFAMVQAGDKIPGGVLWPFISKSREIKYIRPFSYRVMYMGRPAIMTFYYDVTDEKKAQEELAMKAEMLDQVSDLIYMLDTKGIIKYANKAMCECLGYSQGEIMGRSILDFHTEEHRERVKLRLKLATPTSKGKYKTEYVGKNGTEIPVSASGKVINLGGAEYILGVARVILPHDGPI
jgi:PAS domain S-box-containing protein